MTEYALSCYKERYGKSQRIIGYMFIMEDGPISTTDQLWSILKSITSLYPISSYLKHVFTAIGTLYDLTYSGQVGSIQRCELNLIKKILFYIN
jgi:hypothetical protein